MPNTENCRCGVGLPDPKTARSTEFPLRRLAVRGCERTMRSIDEAKRNLRSEILPAVRAADTTIKNNTKKLLTSQANKS